MSNTGTDKKRATTIEYISSISGLSSQQAEQLLDRLEDNQSGVARRKTLQLPPNIEIDYMLRLLYTAIDSAKEMVIITDAPGKIGDEKIIYVNKGIEEVTGYTREELIGKSPSIFQGPETEDETLQRMAESLSTGKHFEGETFNYRKDGSKYRVRWCIDPVRDDTGEITHFISVQQDVTREWEQKKKLEEMVEERESLLSEIHHRVKNNLAVISGLLELQSAKSSSEETKDILKESINRIQSIATLHEKLYEAGDFSNIYLPEYIEGLLNHLIQTLSTGSFEVETHSDIVDCSISVNNAVPLALIINELVTNSFKHGFREGREGNLWISLKQTNDSFILSVSDDGVGLPDDLQINQIQSLGLRLIDTLSNQLEGEYKFEYRNPGTTFTLSFDIPG